MTNRVEDREAAARLTRAEMALALIYAWLAALALLGAASFLTLPPEEYDPLYGAMRVHAAGALICGAGWMIARRARRVRPRVPRIVLLLLVLAWLFSVDRILCVFFPEDASREGIYQLHAERGWTNRPGSTGIVRSRVRIDRHGLRVAEDGPIREIDRRPRVLFLGDSLTFGFGHPARQSFCERSMALLNRRHPGLNATVLNAGVTGYDLGQEYHLLANEGLGLQPDLVVLQVCLNDITNQFDVAYGRDAKRHPEFITASFASHWSGLYRLAVRCMMNLRYGKDREVLRAEGLKIEHFKVAELLGEPPTPRVSPALERTLDQLRAIIRLCREKQIPLVILCFPVQQQVADPRVTTAPQRMFAEEARRNKVPFLDLLSPFEAHIPRSPAAADVLFFDETHPTKLGHRLAAEAIAAFLDASGITAELSKRASLDQTR